MQKQFCVYIWVDPKSGIPRYVGKGLLNRPSKHLIPSADSQISRLLKKRKREGYEIKPHITLVETEDEAFDLEILFIATFGRQDLGEGSLFNKTDGGDGVSGHIFTRESKLKMKEAQEKHWADSSKREQQSNKLKAHFQKPGAKELCGLASKKRFENPEFLAKHKQRRSKPCTVDGVEIFPSLTDLVKSLGWGKKGARSKDFRYVENEND